MLASFLLVLREGLEITLILGILLSALRRLGQANLAKHVWAGAGSALVVSLAAGTALTLLGIRLEGPAEAIFEGLTLFLAAALLTGAIFWMHRRGRRLQEHLAAQVQRTTGRGKKALFLLALVVVGREGLELALFLSAATLSAGSLSTALGVVAGLGLATLLGWGVYTSTVRLNLRAFFLITGGLLLLFAAGLVAHGVHELNEVGWIPPLYAPVWDLNNIIHEDSPAGQLLKTLFGYNGDPSLSEVLAYLSFLIGTGTGLYAISKESTHPIAT